MNASRTPLQGDVTQAIDEAIRAAKAAGIDVDDGPKHVFDADQRPKTSYAFELENLPDAPDVGEIEDALEEIPGVWARIVYPTNTVWITAPDVIDPTQLVKVMARFNVRATMTDSSLRRRVSELRSPEPATTRRGNRGTKGMSGRMRRQHELEAKTIESARVSGFLNDPANTARHTPPDNDLLYTARDLITLKRLAIAIVFGAPVFLTSYFQELQFPGWQWVVLALSIPVVFYAAWPFHRALAGGVRRGLTALDGASSLAILLAFGWSIVLLVATPAGDIGWQAEPKWLAFNHSRLADGELFLDVACGMTILLLAGRIWTMRARPSLLEEMEKRRPEPSSEVRVSVRNRATGAVTEEMMPLAEVNPGDDIILVPGDIIPVDGQVMGGSCVLEPGLVDAREDLNIKVGSKVYSGATIVSGKIKVRVVHTGHLTRMAAIHRWVQEASHRQNRATLLSTKTAAYLIPAAFMLAVADFVLWVLIYQNYNAAMATALAVLASVAPTALALSPAMAIRLGIESSARNGIIIRDGATLRSLENVDTVIFNRVGTLVQPFMTVETVTAARGENADMVLRVAGALAMESNHPSSQALVRAAREARDHDEGGVDIPHWIDVAKNEITRNGDLKARIEIVSRDDDGEEHTQQVEAMLWRPTNLSSLHGRLAAAATNGGTPIVVRWKGKDRGVITLYDPVKDDAAESITRLEDMGIETVMLSRDTYPVARRFADLLGISNVLAGIGHTDKPGAVRAVHTQGATVAMVGDRSVVNTLRVADVGILVGSGDSLETGNELREDISVIVVRDDVSAIPQLIEQARRVCRIIDRNIVYSWVYNISAMVLAVAGLLHPMAATVLMLGSSLFVEARSLSVKKFPS
ncbi:HAD family hydrolase [Corynebacterium breve]|uniref:HAD family hydrolase n=1 Tax=Corynebacterium breve TaxID=3049799 RepID=A0ABY8VEC8_9CORY|nr:HAD family hydrolase [Corynebacterium breve]WIM68021.1 HAD family hydrolase [Corynebacterium breve]